MLFYLSHFTVLSCPLYEAVVVEDSRVSIGGMVEPDKLEINWKEAVTAWTGYFPEILLVWGKVRENLSHVNGCCSWNCESDTSQCKSTALQLH